MKEKILMLLTMFSVICLSSFAPSKEMNHNPTNAVKKTKPTVTVTYPSDFTRYLSLQIKREENKSKKTNLSALFSPYFWWDYSGPVGSESNPYWYVRDSDNIPDCAISGTAYCEIKANANATDESIPVPSSTISIRYQY